MRVGANSYNISPRKKDSADRLVTFKLDINQKRDIFKFKNLKKEPEEEGVRAILILKNSKETKNCDLSDITSLIIEEDESMPSPNSRDKLKLEI